MRKDQKHRVHNRPKWPTAVARQACTVTIGRTLQVTRMHLAGEWTGLRTVNLAARGHADQAGVATAPTTVRGAHLRHSACRVWGPGAMQSAAFVALARSQLPPWLPLPLRPTQQIGSALALTDASTHSTGWPAAGDCASEHQLAQSALLVRAPRVLALMASDFG
jgi:hypothetical protein